ncbi:aldo-keto reductase AKR2E4-like [Anticarsia gemmatalis]|uniref:aldo-keto reductase AKR2E4-like n=1 Tax=Anticarsia gemmatalis TaxID=129554 RepID=UPI003F757C73
MKLLLATVAAFAVISTISAAVRGKAPTKQLNDGNHIPSLGLGSFGFDEIRKMRQAVWDAVQAGYRHIDTAALYGNEVEIGKGIADVIKQGIVKREDLFITTKLWNDKHGRNQVVPALRESLQKLGLEYVDLYLIHSPEATDAQGNTIKVDVAETWQGMEEAKRLGLARSIGVSNFNIEQIDRIIKNSNFVPSVNQIEIHPSNTKEKEVADCFERGIVVVAYSPFGFFVSRAGGGNVVNRNDPKLLNIARKYNKSINQVILRYELDRDLIPIPKSTNPQRIAENINVFDFQLTPEEIGIVGSFNQNKSIFD